MCEQTYHEHCPLCNSSDFIPLKKYHQHHLVRCKACHFVFSLQIPTYEELKQYYQQYSYIEEYYVSPITLKRYEEWLRKLEKFRYHNRILDVGCGNGIFLSVAKKMGWDAYGIEFSKTAANICRHKGITVFEGTLHEHLQALPEMDVIVSIETIEHVPFPAKEIYNMYKILKKGGVLLITTPNFNSLTRRILQGKHPDILYPEHLSYFTSKTLKNLLKTHSFSIWQIKTTGFSISKLKNALSTKQENPFSEQSQDEKIRKKLEENLFLNFIKKKVNQILTLTKLGNSLQAIAIKI